MGDSPSFFQDVTWQQCGYVTYMQRYVGKRPCSSYHDIHIIYFQIKNSRSIEDFLWDGSLNFVLPPNFICALQQRTLYGTIKPFCCNVQTRRGLICFHPRREGSNAIFGIFCPVLFHQMELSYKNRYTPTHTFTAHYYFNQWIFIMYEDFSWCLPINDFRPGDRIYRLIFLALL